MIESSTLVFDELHSRARSSLIALEIAALRATAFKLKDEEKSLSLWIEPAVLLMLKSFSLVDSLDFEEDEKAAASLKVAVLSVSLVRGLCDRLINTSGDSRNSCCSSSSWFEAFHRNSVFQASTSQLHHCLNRATKTPQGNKRLELIKSILGLFTLIGNTKVGCDALLSSDLSQIVWLPLSNVNPSQSISNGEIQNSNHPWNSVFKLSVELMTTLLRIGKQYAVAESVSFVALLQEQLLFYISAPSLTANSAGAVDPEFLELTACVANFVAPLFKYNKLWQLEHRNSFVASYNGMQALLHTSTCYLSRPSFLEQSVSKSSKVSYEEDGNKSADTIGSRTTKAQNLLADISVSSLSILKCLSPELESLITGDLR